MKLMLVARIGLGDWFALMMGIVYLLVGVGTGMIAYQAYQAVALAILAGFFWPLGLAWMLK